MTRLMWRQTSSRLHETYIRLPMISVMFLKSSGHRSYRSSPRSSLFGKQFVLVKSGVHIPLPQAALMGRYIYLEDYLQKRLLFLLKIHDEPTILWPEEQEGRARVARRTSSARNIRHSRIYLISSAAKFITSSLHLPINSQHVYMSGDTSPAWLQIPPSFRELL